MNTAAKLIRQNSTVPQPRLRKRVKPAEVRELYGFTIIGDKVQGYFVSGTASNGVELDPVGPLPNADQAAKVIANLREYFPDEQYRVELRDVDFIGDFELSQQHQSALGNVRVRLNAAYAERHGLFRVIDGWTFAYYVKLKSASLAFVRIGGDDDLPIHVQHGIDPTQSEEATPVGVLGPFEHEEEAVAALLAVARRFPEESFDIHCSQIASGICLPMKLPKQQELARQKVAALSSRWRCIGGFVNYYTLDDHIQRAPFGKLGPFPTLKAMRAAEKAIKAHYPGATVVRRRCGLDGDMTGTNHNELIIEYVKTLEKLAALGA